MAIARVALPLAVDRLFDYWLPEGLGTQPGSVVRVSFGRRRLVGVVVEIVASAQLPPEKIMPIHEVISELPPLPEDVRSLAKFVAAYYQQPIGPCFSDTVPSLGPGPTKADARIGAKEGGIPIPELVLNPTQAAALDAALPEPLNYSPSLLQGVTGSGKTEVYLAAAARVIDQGRQALLLVPEIHLTPQLEQRIAAALPRVRMVTIHSAVSTAERRRRWLAAARGDADLVLGTRLAIFVPMPRLGLIAVDEEHDPSFRQQDGVRYHARDLAIYRARLRGVPVLLGSATPSLESYVHARRGRYRWLKLPRRARPESILPSVRLVPARGHANDGIG